MLFQVRMNVHLPHGMPPEQVESLKLVERQRAQALQRSGTWRHLWRVAGQYANVSIFDVQSIDELHQLLSTLPLFPYMQIEVTALCRHASSIHEDDR